MRDAEPIAVPAAVRDGRRPFRGRIDLDLRDHAVLAGALGIVVGATNPIADGAPDVAALSAAIGARWPDHVVRTAAEIVAARKPFGLRLPAWRALYGREALLNWVIWAEDLTAPGGPATPPAPPEALQLARRVALLLGGAR